MSRYQFSLGELFYGVALLGACMALLGNFGIPIAIIIAVFGKQALLKTLRDRAERIMIDQALARTGPENSARTKAFVPANRLSSPEGITQHELLAVIVTVGILVGFTYQGVHIDRSSQPIHLYQISQALATYEQIHNQLPSPNGTQAADNPPHSWRVDLLPYIGQEDLYARYRFDEPWDGPNNKQLIPQMPLEYASCRYSQSSSDPVGETRLFAISGEGTAWNAQSDQLRSHPIDHPILLLLEGYKSVPWTKPENISLDMLAQFAKPPSSLEIGSWSQGYFRSRYNGQAAIIFQSNQYEICNIQLSEVADLKRLCSVDDRTLTNLQFESLNQKTVVSKVHYGNIARLCMFVLVVLYPSRTLWRLR